MDSDPGRHSIEEGILDRSIRSTACASDELGAPLAGAPRGRRNGRGSQE